MLVQGLHSDLPEEKISHASGEWNAKYIQSVIN